MTLPLTLLVIEDSEADFLMEVRSLKQHGVEAEFHRVDNYEALVQALESDRWDAILSDYNLPGMDFRTTLGIIRDQAPDLPVILVSGSIGEEEAMELLHRGLTDFVLKDRPTRLAGALRHSLDTARVRQAQRVAEAALQESEGRLSTIFKSSPLGIGLSRLEDGILVDANDALLAIFENRREELIGHTSLELGHFVHPEERARMMALVQRNGRVRNFEIRARRSSGEILDLLMSGERIQIGGEAFLLGMLSDITPLKEAERSLKASEARYRSLFESMSEAFAHCRMIGAEGQPDWEYLAVNPAYARVTGLTDVVGRRMREILPSLPTDNPGLIKRLSSVVADGIPAKFETFLPALNLWLSVSAYRPAPGEFVVMLDDITTRKRAEQALQDSEARFQAIFRGSPVGILLSRPEDGAILDANPAFLGLLGLRMEDILGRSTVNLGLWANPAERETALRRIRERGRIKAMDADLRAASGELVSVIWSTELAVLDREQVLVNMIQDRTEQRMAEAERRTLEAEVAHAQKLESLGALAGGVSHDMNNVLAAVMALGSMLKEQRQDDPLVSRSMDTLLHAAGRGRDLVKGLTDFARKDIPEPKPMDLAEVVRKEAALLSRTTLQKVQVDLVLAENLPQVMGDSNSISNVLMNLCVNALDAMPAGGTLTLTARVGAGCEVEVSVKDSGEGMTPEVIRRAMEPFFTTKPAGKGTGLGLALVYGVMKSHGGSVEIASERGTGTEVILRFPPMVGKERQSAKEGLPDEPVQAARLRVLLVDDDDLIRSTVPAMLEALGHEAEALQGGLQAIQHLQSGYDPDLVILDLSMPEMDGETALERLRLLRPDLPVLLATGYQDERCARILTRFPDVDTIMKPFTLMELRLKLAQLG